jgi:hypothetical protein
MGNLTNRAPEVNPGYGWMTATSVAAARRTLQHEGSGCVRLRVGDRVLLEDVLKKPIAVGTDLNAYIEALDTTTLSTDQQWAVGTIKDS